MLYDDECAAPRRARARGRFGAGAAGKKRGRKDGLHPTPWPRTSREDLIVEESVLDTVADDLAGAAAVRCPLSAVRLRSRSRAHRPRRGRKERTSRCAGADLVLWLGISFEQSASVEHFRRSRHALAAAGRGDTLQLIVNPSEDALPNVVRHPSLRPPCE